MLAAPLFLVPMLPFLEALLTVMARDPLSQAEWTSGQTIEGHIPAPSMPFYPGAASALPTPLRPNNLAFHAEY